MTTYTRGEWTIERGEWGARGGIEWGLWRGGKLLSTYRTLRSAKRAAAWDKTGGEWIKSKATVEVLR